MPALASGLYAILVLIVTAVSSWVIAVRMRRRIRTALGKEVSELELTSTNTWMEVSDAEERLETQAHRTHNETRFAQTRRV